MTYKIDWLTPGRVIDLTLPDVCDDKSVEQYDSDVLAMLDTASEPIHIVLDARFIRVYPSAQSALRVRYYKHPQLGRMLVIGMTSNPVLRFLGSLVARGAGLQLRDFSTREEALAYLATIEKA